MKKLKRVNGQSLAEFAVTTAMMATLATTAAPKFSGVGEGAKEKKTLADIDKILKAEKDYQKEMAPFNRKQRILDSAMEFLNYTLTSPKILSDLRRESDYVQNRLLQAKLRSQAFPNEVQRRMATGSAAFATEAEAIAKQQEAATELAKAGIRTPTATFSA